LQARRRGDRIARGERETEPQTGNGLVRPAHAIAHVESAVEERIARGRVLKERVEHVRRDEVHAGFVDDAPGFEHPRTGREANDLAAHLQRRLPFPRARSVERRSAVEHQLAVKRDDAPDGPAQSERAERDRADPPLALLRRDELVRRLDDRVALETADDRRERLDFDHVELRRLGFDGFGFDRFGFGRFDFARFDLGWLDGGRLVGASARCEQTGGERRAGDGDAFHCVSLRVEGRLQFNW